MRCWWPGHYSSLCRRIFLLPFLSLFHFVSFFFIIISLNGFFFLLIHLISYSSSPRVPFRALETFQSSLIEIIQMAPAVFPKIFVIIYFHRRPDGLGMFFFSFLSLSLILSPPYFNKKSFWGSFFFSFTLFCVLPRVICVEYRGRLGKNRPAETRNTFLFSLSVSPHQDPHSSIRTNPLVVRSSHNRG